MIDKVSEFKLAKFSFNNIGSILNKATDEIQNAAYIVNDLKHKENVDIKTLKTMHGTLEKVLKE